MKNYYCLIFAAVALLQNSCYPAGWDSRLIPANKIIGEYRFPNGGILTINADSTCVYPYVDSTGTVRHAGGVWEYVRFETARQNVLYTYDMRAKGKNNGLNYDSEYQTHMYYLIKHWNGIHITATPQIFDSWGKKVKKTKQ